MRQQGTNVPDAYFEYTLSGTGWARADLRVGAARVSLRVSYLTDGLGDLVRAAIAIAEGVHDQTVTWVEEPGCHEVAIGRRAGSATIQVWHYDGPSRSHFDDIGEPTLHERCSVYALCEAISSGTQRVLARYGAEGYREQWHAHDFPLTDAARLAQLVSTTDRWGLTDGRDLSLD